MSSALPLASGMAAAKGRPLATRAAADNHSSSAAFAVKPVIAPQDVNPDASPPSEPVVIAVGSGDAPATPLITYSAEAILAGQSARTTAPNASPDAAVETAAPPLAAENAVPMSRAASAYAQTMQAGLDSKTTQIAAALRPTSRTSEGER